MEKIEKILSIGIKIIFNIILVVLTIIALMLVYNIIQIKVMEKEYMNIFGYSFFQVQTGSMSGAIEIGDIVIVKITKDVKENDIITYKTGDILVTHRIEEKKGNEIITKGDANNARDEAITEENVVGKVVYTIKNVEIWKQVFLTPEVYILIIITLVLFGISMSMNGGNNGKREKSLNNTNKFNDSDSNYNTDNSDNHGH